MLAHSVHHFVEGADHNLLKARVDLVGVPHQPFLVLDPLEVADGDAAGVGENVREHDNAAAREDFIGVRRGGAVGGFGDDTSFDGLGVVKGYYIFQRRWNKDVALHGEQLVVGDARGAGHTYNGSGTLFVANGFDGINAAGIGDATAGIAESDDFCFLLGEEAGGGGAGVTESLNRDGSAAQRNLLQLAGFFNYVEQAARGGFAATLRAADGDRLTGDDAVRRMADGHGVGVHDPSHRLRVGINVRGGNVLRRTDDGQYFAGIAARHAFKLALGHALGVANHAALGSAKRNADGGGLPGHPSRERLYFIQRDIGMEANAAFAGPARHVVLHTVAGEDFHLAVVHLRGQGNFQHALGSAQNLPQAKIELQEFGSHVKLNLRDAKRVQILAGSDAGHHGRHAYLSCRGCGLCDRGHWRRSFRLLDLSKQLCSSLGPGSVHRNSGYPFAASFFELTAYASRQAVEQKCTSSPPSRNGMERVSSTCIPHTGSRTNRRAAVGVSIEASAACGPGAVSFRSMPPTMRRKSRKLQERTSSQNRNLTMRARKFILMIVS